MEQYSVLVALFRLALSAVCVVGFYFEKPKGSDDYSEPAEEVS